MTSTTPAPQGDPIGQAIDALTVIARSTRTVVAAIGAERHEPEDFAGVLADILTAVAANVGGTDTLVAGRPGSWEAQHVHALAGGDMPDDELLRHRTAPVPLYVSPEYQLEEFGLHDLLDDAALSLDQPIDEAQARLYEAGVTPEERARLTELDEQVRGEGDPVGGDVAWERHKARMQERYDLRDAAVQRGRERDAQAAAAYDALVARQQRLTALWDADVAAYRQTAIDTARALLDERGVTAPVVLVEDAPPFPMPGVFYDGVGDLLTGQVIERAPLPMTGRAPDYRDGPPADAVRRAGRDYLARLDQA